jgi:hypothetical protein
VVIDFELQLPMLKSKHLEHAIIVLRVFCIGVAAIVLRSVMAEPLQSPLLFLHLSPAAAGVRG